MLPRQLTLVDNSGFSVVSGDVVQIWTGDPITWPVQRFSAERLPILKEFLVSICSVLLCVPGNWNGGESFHIDESPQRQHIALAQLSPDGEWLDSGNERLNFSGHSGLGEDLLVSVGRSRKCGDSDFQKVRASALNAEEIQGDSLHCKNGSVLKNVRSCRALEPLAYIRLDLVAIRRTFERCLRNQDVRSRSHEEFIRDRAMWRLERLIEGTSLESGRKVRRVRNQIGLVWLYPCQWSPWSGLRSVSSLERPARRHEAFVVIMCMYLSLFVDFRVPTVMSLNRAIL